MKNYLHLLTVSFCVLMLSACTMTPRQNAIVQWKKNQQMILVLSSDWNSNQGVLLQFEYKHSRWIHIGQSFNVSLGKNGAAWGIGLHPYVSQGIVKTEGDMRSPTGIFKIGSSFGYAKNVDRSYPYQALTKDDYCIDNSLSPYYNQIVNHQKVLFSLPQDSTEPMRRDIHYNGDQLYKLGFVLNYNPNNIPNAGSCIFVHLRKDRYATTAGCTSMDEVHMRALLSWLNSERNPVFVLLPLEAYEQKHKEWNLPNIKWEFK
ncbi:L,D-transpeptidase [Commensalibacter papalotli (ex Botero et al. 2024)]|uniref:ErfK/YbiS/YcfS/YnhG family (PUBMED:16647082) n=1 Tax=Commensalibacter papalotli (ex Botero et al. 2024) TaxID=2972766 RepID=A0ABN8W2I2_9PROT|nr:L,D-transpeptidase family protein [Commensalibacter papalotli (ex Botero et al. 2024)]CAI3925966.1 D-peptidoglycan transpeptidase YkuD [Commensalibacter papalotli (ex Botero et al. 2024)]CAI3926086.1 D-peptidoglycan transpeptidase YkuD [Commensalibacter papalotli (ex Botero et al. 2024)]